ncbi:MAG: histidine kinase N-terminal 7TM domain-containing protein [Chloroflexota bacterium]
MESLSHIIPACLIILAGHYAGAGLFTWRRRPGLAFAPFAWLMAAIAIRSLGDGLELLAPTLSGKLLAAEIEMLGIVSAPVFFISFCAAFTGQNYLLTAQKQALLWVIPALTVLLSFTNPYHHLIWERAWIDHLGELAFLGTESGNWLRLQTAYTHVLLLIGLAFLIVDIFRSSASLQRTRTGIVLAGAALPWISSMLYTTRSWPGIDLTPFLFLPATLVMMWGILRYRLLDVVPMAPAMILNDLQDGILVVDAQRRVLFLNAAAEKILGAPLDASFGQPIERIRPECVDSLSRLIDQGEPYIEKTFLWDGENTIFDIRIAPIATAGSGNKTPAPGYLVNFRNIHHRKQVEVDLERREAMLGAINMAAQQFLKTAAWEANIPAFLERLGQVAGVSRAYVFQNYHGQDSLLYTSQTYEWTARDAKPRLDDPKFRHIPIKQIGPAGWSDQLSQGKLITAIANELALSEQQALLDPSIRSIMLAPIFVEGNWWGFLGLEDHTNERPWRKAELESLQAATDIFSAAEMRARNEFTLRRRQRTINLLHDVVLTALQANDMLTMSDALVRRLSELVNADGCFLSSWNEATQVVTPLAGYGQHRDIYLAIEPEKDETTLTGSVLQAGHTLIVEDVENTPYLSQRIIDMFPYRSALAFPLTAGAKRLGALLLAYNHQRRFQPEEISIGEQAASLIALALEKFQAVEAASKRAEESETLRRASAAVVETLRSNEAVDRILEQLSYVLPYDSASVQLLRENELEIVGGRGWDEQAIKEVMGLRFPVPGDNPNTVVIQTGKPYILDDAKKFYQTFNQEPHSHIRSWLGIPLMARGQVTGLLVIDSTEPDHFKADDVKMAVAFADQVAIALENARLFEEAQNMALTDALTDLYNRRGLFEIGRLEFSRARRSNRPFSAVMVDIDHFKRINDLHGHAIGDQALQSLGGHLRNITRDVDIVGRYGGEEFVFLLSETPLEAAREMAERLRHNVESASISTDVDGLRMTISLGVAAYSTETPDLETLIARADQALYMAKHKGRNRVEIGK